MKSTDLNFWNFLFQFKPSMNKWALVITVDDLEVTYDHYHTKEQCKNVQEYLLNNDEWIEL